MYCLMHNSFASVWFVIYAFGFVAYAQPLGLIPAAIAAMVALGVFRWTETLEGHGYRGGMLVAHRVIVGVTFVAALAGLAATSTSVASSYDTSEQHLRDTPLAVFFLITAILAWRSLARPDPRRTSAIPLFVYFAWAPFVVWNELHALGNVPHASDWQEAATRSALWGLLAGGGVLCWLATRAAPEEQGLPSARVR